MIDEFKGDNARLIVCIESLLDLDASNALVPHGIGGHARGLLSAAGVRLAAKDAEIAELRKQLAESQESLVATLQAVRHERDAAEAAGLTSIAERDEARECVRRLYKALNGVRAIRRSYGDNAGPILQSVCEALAATPEHLR